MSAKEQAAPPKVKVKVTDDDSMTSHAKRKVVVYGDIDGGWAWVALVGIMFWNSVFAGTLKSFGVLYLEFLDLYGRGPVATAWIGFSFSFITTILAPVSGYLGDQLSLGTQRYLVMVLAVLTTAAVAVTGSMPTLEGAIVTYGLAGLSAAIIDTPILSLMGKYFRKRRFFASGIIAAGSSFGTLVIPPIITVLVKEYTIRGAMILFGGIWLNNVVVGAVIRPLKPVTSFEPELADDGEGNIPAKKKSNTLLSNHNTISLDVFPHGMSPFLGSSNLSVDKQLRERRQERLITVCKSVPSSPRLKPSNNGHVYHSVHELNEKNLTETKNILNGFHQQCNENETETKQNGVNSHRNLGSPKEDRRKPDSPQKKILWILSGYWNFLKSPGLPLLVASFCMASFAYYNQFFLLPPFGQEIGMTKLEGALLISLPNCMEIVSRLLVGTLVDRQVIQKTSLVKISFLIAAVISMTISFYPVRLVLFLYAGVFGLVGGIFVPLCLPLMVELVADEYIGSATAMFVVLTGIGISLGPPILGAVTEAFGSYGNCFRICSVGYIVALVLYLFQNGDILKWCRLCRKDKSSSKRRESPHEPITLEV